MYNTESKTKTKDRLVKISNRLTFLTNQPIVKAYVDWKNMDAGTKLSLETYWTNYYIQAKNSPSAERFWKIRDAWKANDFITVKKLAKEARLAKEENDYPPQPSEYDPNEFKRDYMCQEYERIIDEQNYLKQNKFIEAEDIFS